TTDGRQAAHAANGCRLRARVLFRKRSLRYPTEGPQIQVMFVCRPATALAVTAGRVCRGAGVFAVQRRGSGTGKRERNKNQLFGPSVGYHAAKRQEVPLIQPH